MKFELMHRDEAWVPMAELWNLEYPLCRRTAEEMSGPWNALPLKGYQRFWVAHQDEHPIASISLFCPDRAEKPKRLEGELLLDPRDSRAWTEPAVRQMELACDEVRVTNLSFWTHDQDPERLTVLDDLGYRVIQTVPASMLDLTAFDFERFSSTYDRVRTAYRLTNILELESEGVDWVPGLWDATWEMAEDMPNPHTPTRVPLDEYREMIANELIFKKPFMFAAMDGDRLVGYTRFIDSKGEPGLAMTGMSGVVRTHRRQGIVTALKVLSILKMRELGFKTLMTDNDETNPMFQLNLTLGFTPHWRWNLMSKGHDASAGA